MHKDSRKSATSAVAQGSQTTGGYSSALMETDLTGTQIRSLDLAGLVSQKQDDDLPLHSPGPYESVKSHRCPTYQLHLPRKRDLGTPKTLSREMPENSGEIQGFLLSNIEMPRKRANPGNSGKFVLGIPNGHFGMIFLGG